MKLIKAKIEVTHPDTGSTEYVGYPAVWLSNKGRISAVLDDNRQDETVENGKFYKYLHAIVPDDLYDEFIADTNIFSAPVLAEVREKTDRNNPRTEVWNDERKVKTILVKQARGETLTQVERNALDPNHPETGVSMSKDFIDLCGDYGVSNI